jgi:DUF1016 N-terminal domain
VAFRVAQSVKEDPRMARKDDPKKKPSKAAPKQSGLVPMGYEKFLGELKERIRTAQLKAAVSVNRELVLLYWQIGRDILARQKEHGWGAKVIDRLAGDLRREFPGMEGFSPRNLKYMDTVATKPGNEITPLWPYAALRWCWFCLGLDSPA